MRRVNGKIEEITESEVREIAQQQGIQYIYLVKQLQEQGAKIICDYPTEGSVQTAPSTTSVSHQTNVTAKPSKTVRPASATSQKAQPKVSANTARVTMSAVTKKPTTTTSTKNT